MIRLKNENFKITNIKRFRNLNVKNKNPYLSKFTQKKIEKKLRTVVVIVEGSAVKCRDASLSIYQLHALQR